jgi:hypothetical protein
MLRLLWSKKTNFQTFFLLLYDVVAWKSYAKSYRLFLTVKDFAQGEPRGGKSITHPRKRERRNLSKKGHFDHTLTLQTGKSHTVPSNHNPKDLQDDERAQRLAIRTSQNTSKGSTADKPLWPMSEAVAIFRLLSGQDCLAKLIYHIELFSCRYCILSDQRQEMDQHHLLRCTALFST